MEDVRLILSALWVAVAFCLIFVAHLGLTKPGYIEGLIAGEIDGIKFTPNVVVGNAITMIIPSVMVFLSLTVPYPMIRWVNIIFSIGFLGIILMTLAYYFTYKVQYGAYYYVFKFTESVLYALIIRYAWMWV